MRVFKKDIPFIELYNGLQKEVDAGNIWVREDGDLRLYVYSDQCTYNRAWNEFSKMARGLILDVANEGIIARPFEKFFNYGEEQDIPIPNEPFEAYEKVDGSMGTLYSYKGQWRVATKGSFNSPQAQWAQNFLDTKVRKECLSHAFTYVLEIVYPEDRKVVDYGKEKFFSLLSVFQTQLGYELPSKYVDNIAKEMGIKRPTYYSFNSLDDILKSVETLPKDMEGYVVKFNSGYRLKIKGKEYLRLFKILSSTSPLSIWEGLMTDKDVEKDLNELNLPEDFLKEQLKTVDIMKGKFQKFLSDIEVLHEKYKDLSDKEMGTQLKDLMTIENNPAMNYLFTRRKKNFDPIKNKRLRENIFNEFRPTGNILE